jgi:hypothetical protein
MIDVFLTYLAAFFLENCVMAVHVPGIIFPSAYVEMGILLYCVILKEENLHSSCPKLLDHCWVHYACYSPSEIPDHNASVRNNPMIEVLLISVGSDHGESKLGIKRICGRKIPPHVHISLALSERPIICSCCLNVQWPVSNPVSSLQCFLSKDSTSLDSLSIGCYTTEYPASELSRAKQEDPGR